jgi:protein TonB
MSTTPPPASSPSRRGPAAPFWRLSRRTWLLVAAAFAAGLLLFLLSWSGRRDHDFFRATPVARPGRDTPYEPLPAPLPADQQAADKAPAAETDAVAGTETPTPRIVEDAPAPPPVSAAPPVAGRALAPSPGTAGPVPMERPAPRYPTQAARRGLEGSVRVRVDVGADGVPTSVAIVEGSGTRELDRAALEAVRRWRFRPGLADGKPVAGSVVVPIEFAMRH